MYPDTLIEWHIFILAVPFFIVYKHVNTKKMFISFPHFFPDVIMTESQKVFDDVIEDFSAISIILCHFEKWKHQQQESYEEAYISLCLPKLLAPLVRLQLLDWNPLQVFHFLFGVLLRGFAGTSFVPNKYTM